ncbi:MAG: lipopolysaccharide biosynthesis protein [Chitinophagaceae bacterium]|nr:lipopolysaccharide biosynthesis protein [Chitinophagaceae bacterium]
MSSIRRQSIISSVVIYIGFAVGLLNTYLFTKEGNFDKAEYGLTTIFIAIAVLMNGLTTLGMPAYITKFFPYYKDHLPPKKNDMLSLALLVSIVGFLVIMTLGIVLKSLVIQKFGANAPLLVTYYYWVFPFGLGLIIFTILEAYTWNLGKPVVTNFFKEVAWRLFITVIIVFFIMGVIKDFDTFIKLFSFTFPAIAIGLLFYLLITKKIHFTFKLSKVTRRYSRKIILLCSFFYGAVLLQALSKVFDSFVIASKLEDGLDKAGIFALATIVTSIMLAPQRGIITASMPRLSRAWKEKDMSMLQKVYQRSSINQLLFACAIFLLIWLNFTDAVITFGLKPDYLDAAPVFFILGISVIIDMGTGVNAQIISTSVFWRFELISGVILIAIMLPLTYILTVQLGIIGPAYGTLISMAIYNSIRIIFLRNKFNLFPLTIQSLYTVLLAAACYGICYFACRDMSGIAGMLVRSIAFILLYGLGAVFMKLSPDIQPVLQAIKKRLRIKTN